MVLSQTPELESLQKATNETLFQLWENHAPPFWKPYLNMDHTIDDLKTAEYGAEFIAFIRKLESTCAAVEADPSLPSTLAAMGVLHTLRIYRDPLLDRSPHSPHQFLPSISVKNIQKNGKIWKYMENLALNPEEKLDVVRAFFKNTKENLSGIRTLFYEKSACTKEEKEEMIKNLESQTTPAMKVEFQKAWLSMTGLSDEFEEIWETRTRAIQEEIVTWQTLPTQEKHAQNNDWIKQWSITNPAPELIAVSDQVIEQVKGQISDLEDADDQHKAPETDDELVTQIEDALHQFATFINDILGDHLEKPFDAKDISIEVNGKHEGFMSMGGGILKTAAHRTFKKTPGNIVIGAWHEAWHYVQMQLLKPQLRRWYAQGGMGEATTSIIEYAAANHTPSTQLCFLKIQHMRAWGFKLTLQFHNGDINEETVSEKIHEHCTDALSEEDREKLIQQIINNPEMRAQYHLVHIGFLDYLGKQKESDLQEKLTHAIKRTAGIIPPWMIGVDQPGAGIRLGNNMIVPKFNSH